MFNKDTCRVCLADKAKYSIFEDIESKDSIHSKLFQCLNEKIEDIEGYPRKICDSCMNNLDTVHKFISKYKASCKLLESSFVIVKKEVNSDDDSDIELLKMVETEICKKEPDSVGLDTVETFIKSLPLAQVKQKKTKSLNDIKAKLKKLTEINIKKKPVQNNGHKTRKVASSILEGEFDWNGESLKSNKLKQLKESKPKQKKKELKLVLPKIPKAFGPPPLKLCDICGEVYKSSDKLSQHRKLKHFRQAVKCPECPRIFTADLGMQRHLNRSHRKKLLICDTCGRRFAYKTDLNKHIKVVHLGIKRKQKTFKCKLCDKTYVVAKSLLIHERSAHTGVRPAECKVCGSCFFHEDYLKEHMRLHTGEAPFKCPICGRGYAQRGNMRSHLSHNHRLADLNEETLRKIKPSLLKYLKQT